MKSFPHLGTGLIDPGTLPQSVRTDENSNPISLRVTALSKTYRVWQSPVARFSNAIAEEIHRLSAIIFGKDHSLTRRWDRRLGTGFRQVHALRDVSLKIGRGEVVGILGFNGSGKSTLLQMLAGTLTPTSGSIEVYGRVAALLELGSGINPEFTGRENAYLYGSILGFPRDFMKERMHLIEEFAEIGEFMDEPVKTYSTGMVTRLAFSVLTQLDPDILIVDEALSVGDAYFQNKSINLIKRFQQAGKTMLVVSHSSSAIKSMCSRAIILERGVLVREGPADAVCDYYNALVAKKQKDQEIQQVERERGRIVTRSGDRRAVIGNVELVNAAGKPARAFMVGETAHFACAVEFRVPVPDPTVGILIRDRLANDVFGTNTHNQSVPLGDYAAGERCEVRFETKLNLAPGRYSVTAAIHSGQDHLMDNYDWQDNVIVFDVLPGPEKRFIGTAWLPIEITLNRNSVVPLLIYQWGKSIDFSADGDSVRFKRDGWGISETQFTWTVEPDATVCLELPASKESRHLHVTAAAFTTAQISAQRVEVYLDDTLVARWQVGAFAEQVAPIPSTLLAVAGRRFIRFALPDATSPHSVGISNDRRLLGLRVHALTIH